MWKLVWWSLSWYQAEKLVFRSFTVWRKVPVSEEYGNVQSLWTDHQKTFIVIKLNFFFFSPHLLKYKKALFRWQSPKNSVSFSLLHYFYTSTYQCKAHWSATQLLSKLTQHNLYWCSRKWRALLQMKHGVWVRSAVISGSLSCALTRASCDLVAADFLAESC